MVNGVARVDANNIIGPDVIHRLAVEALQKAGFAATDANLQALAGAAGYTQGTSWDRARATSFLTSDAALAAVKAKPTGAVTGMVGPDQIHDMAVKALKAAGYTPTDALLQALGVSAGYVQGSSRQASWVMDFLQSDAAKAAVKNFTTAGVPAPGTLSTGGGTGTGSTGGTSGTGTGSTSSGGSSGSNQQAPMGDLNLSFDLVVGGVAMGNVTKKITWPTLLQMWRRDEQASRTDARIALVIP